MLNWFTFSLMLLTIILLLVTCYYLDFRQKSENQTIEHLLKTYINICDSLENDKQELINKIASLQKQIKLMQNCDLEKVIEKQQKEIEDLKNGGKK